MNKVKVVIPIYKPMLSDYEKNLLTHNLGVLCSRSIVFLLPESLDTSALSSQFDISPYEQLRVSDEWLGAKNGRGGYNNMMMSADFYRLFSDVDYILICQTDVYMFSDQLDTWCAKSYDYVGAPWVKRKVYDLPVVRHYLALRRKMNMGDSLDFMRQQRFNKVGNGGLSLRKVSSSIAVCEEYTAEIAYFSSQTNHMYNEDVFWALVPQNFSRPQWSEALKFSFDVYPDYCYELNNYELPMGCHGVATSRIYNFWRNIIHIKNEELETAKAMFLF